MSQPLCVALTLLLEKSIFFLNFCYEIDFSKHVVLPLIVRHNSIDSFVISFKFVCCQTNCSNISLANVQVFHFCFHMTAHRVCLLNLGNVMPQMYCIFLTGDASEAFLILQGTVQNETVLPVGCY